MNTRTGMPWPTLQAPGSSRLYNRQPRHEPIGSLLPVIPCFLLLLLIIIIIILIINSTCASVYTGEGIEIIPECPAPSSGISHLEIDAIIAHDVKKHFDILDTDKSMRHEYLSP